MKTVLYMLSALIFITGCKKATEPDTTPPPAPQGIATVSLNNAIEIQWLPSQANDVKGYKVWVSNAYDGQYELIGSTTLNYFTDEDAVNGVTYYYAVSAFDFNNNDSPLSKDVVYDTPRPEGLNVLISEALSAPNTAGYDFSAYSLSRYNALETDFYYADISGIYYLNVRTDSDIQDMGYTTSLDEISSSPSQGWAPSKSAEAIAGHTYVIWTWDNHYAKVRVREATSTGLLFDWAYQTAAGNRELRIADNRPTAVQPKQSAGR